jgi:hypothetical protein
MEVSVRLSGDYTCRTLRARSPEEHGDSGSDSKERASQFSGFSLGNNRFSRVAFWNARTIMNQKSGREKLLISLLISLV